MNVIWPTANATVEASKAKRTQRQQARFRDRGGCVPACVRFILSDVDFLAAVSSCHRERTLLLIFCFHALFLGSLLRRRRKRNVRVFPPCHQFVSRTKMHPSLVVVKQRNLCWKVLMLWPVGCFSLCCVSAVDHELFRKLKNGPEGG